MTQRRLSALHVGNFKAFGEIQRIPLKPITLIFGPNSAGKSSFIHSLALAHEAQFGRDKRSFDRLDVHHTEIGGSSIDLGGFRQYVHRGQAANRVEWGAELEVAAMTQRSRELLAGVSRVSITLSIGIELDDQDRPEPGKSPRVESVVIAGDGDELLRMSHRRSDTHGSLLRLDRLAVEHPVFEQIISAIIGSFTTAENLQGHDLAGASEAVADLLPELRVRIERFFPNAVELPAADSGERSVGDMLFAVSKGNRKEDIAQAVRFYLPRTLNDLVKGISDALSDELDDLLYLGPLRSLPPRHIAFAENEDANWYAGGGYTWELVKRDADVREAVNGWLGNERMKTPYSLVVRTYISREAVEIGTRTWHEYQLEVDKDGEYLEMESAEIDPQTGMPLEEIDRYRDPEHRKTLDDSDATARELMKFLDELEPSTLSDLVLLDKRSNTVVSHRDVGIGISQVLPVLVTAYASSNKLIAMEQPEIHLHPALQADLGDVFIEAALGERQNTFILETHSEHLILRLMRRMRETWQNKDTGLPAVTPDDVMILYIEPDGSRSIVREMPLNEAGDLVKAWPGGFFEEGLREQFGDS